MKLISEIIGESSNVNSNINWLAWNKDNLNKVYKNIIEECNNKKENYYSVNILVVTKEKKKNGESDKFKGEYKIMTSEMWIRYKENINSIEFWPKNISEKGIIVWAPMNESLPEFYK